MENLRSSCSARSACRTLPAPVRSCSPCRSRATCMVSVEPPETMRLWRMSSQAGAPDCVGIDAAMGAEPLVLEGHQHGEIARVDVLHFDRQAPAAIGGRVGAQQPIVAIEHGHGQRLGARKRAAAPCAARRRRAPPPRRKATAPWQVRFVERRARSSPPGQASARPFPLSRFSAKWGEGGDAARRLATTPTLRATPWP